jgi:hypothetical protein
MYCDDECLATAEYIDEEVSGRCQRYYAPDYIQYRKCASGRESLAPLPKPTLAAQRWADCDDVAELRKRGQAYEHAWVKATARELDLMIEIQRLRRKLAAMTDEDATDEPR